MKRLLIVIVAAVSASVGSVATAQASCAGPPGAGPAGLAAQINAAPIVFVGTVVGTSRSDRVARVRVESIWKGPIIPTLVTVSGSPEPNSAATSVDRTFKVGERYLFVPFSTSSPFEDNSCSATRAYTSQLDALKPATTQPPSAGSDGLNPMGSALSFWLWPGLAALALIAVTGLWILVHRRRRRGLASSSALDPR